MESFTLTLLCINRFIFLIFGEANFLLPFVIAAHTPGAFIEVLGWTVLQNLKKWDEDSRRDIIELEYN